MGIYSAKVTSKGQITLPIELREALGIKPGDQILFREDPNGKVQLVAQRGRFSDLHGIVRLKGPRPTNEDIDRWIDEARGSRWNRYVEQVSADRSRKK